jgi:hypothetical protein
MHYRTIVRYCVFLAVKQNALWFLVAAQRVLFHSSKYVVPDDGAEMLSH